MDEATDLFKKAQMYLRSAAVLFELEDYDSTASRAYFSMFYAAQAALLSEDGTLPSERGIRTAFRERFVDSGLLPERAADVLERAHDLQEVGDYAHIFAVSADDAEWLLSEAEAFVNSLERLVERVLQA